jgi:hypothetical protein
MNLVIGISGKLQSGKDAIAARLVERWGFRVVRFADALKEEVLERLPRTLDVIHQIVGHEHELQTCSLAQRPECIRDMVYNRKPRGVRELLQEYGTEVRRRDRETYWTDQWKRRAGDVGCVVASDVRFPDEAATIIQAGGLLWRVERPGYSDVPAQQNGQQAGHVSETLMDDWPRWDARLRNVGTIEDLHIEVDMLMTTAGKKACA